jgi:hypothetical protein
VQRAVRELMAFVGGRPMAVVGMERHDGGWRVSVEVTEVERVPNTSSIMAAYAVELDDDGELTRYNRTERYVRGRTSDD